MDSFSSLIHSTVPVICTDDIDRSLSYYIDILGFSFDFKYGDPPVYAGVKSGNAEIYFTCNPALTHLIKENGLPPDIFIWVEDAGLLFKEHTDKGAEVVEPIAERPWGARQYVIKEINGYHLKFAQPFVSSGGPDT
jgi:catechol 2,3-dioxygenase-like lactoylglutathione lyase family enzyme